MPIDRYQHSTSARARYASFTDVRAFVASPAKASLPNPQTSPQSTQSTQLQSQRPITSHDPPTVTKPPVITDHRNYGGSLLKSPSLDRSRLRHQPRSTASSISSPHDFGLHYATYAAPELGTSSWSYTGAAKWPGYHNGGCFPGQVEVEQGWRRCTG